MPGVFQLLDTLRNKLDCTLWHLRQQLRPTLRTSEIRLRRTVRTDFLLRVRAALGLVISVPEAQSRRSSDVVDPPLRSVHRCMANTKASSEAASEGSSMIVCSCNVLSDREIRNVATAARVQPLSAHQVYGCLGCNMRCGRCARTVKQILSESLIGAQSLGRPYRRPPAVPNEGAGPANVCCTAGFRSGL
jgi:bacterioferritin-associated ferredoxin